MINLEEVKENTVRGVRSMTFEREGIFKYIINYEKGTVVCMFDLGMKRALNEIYKEYTHIMCKSFLGNYNGPLLDEFNKILSYPHSWDTYLKTRAKNERKLSCTDDTISNMIIRQIRKGYGKNIAKMPEFKGIAKCNTEVDSFDEELGKKLAKCRMLKKFEEFKYKCIRSYIFNLTETLSIETANLRERHYNALYYIMREENNSVTRFN